MKKSELRKIIRGVIKEQAVTGCSQYTFPLETPGAAIGDAQWCDNIMNYYAPSYYTNLLSPWCNGENESPWGPFPQGFLDSLNSIGEMSACGMCHCLEQDNTPPGPPGTKFPKKPRRR